MKECHGEDLRRAVSPHAVIPFIGVYDVFSASIAASHFNGIFISGFGFAASFYGLPDIGFIAWSDMVSFVQRVRAILPAPHIIVDIDDGYCDPEVACHVVSLLEKAGASGIILEDQQRPRKCGHCDGKQLLPLDQFLDKLRKVLDVRRGLFVIARTDATDAKEIMKRGEAVAACGVDSILVDGISDLDLLARLKKATRLPVAYSQMTGGRTPRLTLQQLQQAGVSLTVYSTPCLFPAQAAIASAMKSLKENDGLLPQAGEGCVDLAGCAALLHDNLNRRNGHG